MNNEKEIERMLQFSNYCKPKSGDCEVCLGCDQYNLVKALINAGIGDKKQAVKEFCEKLKDRAEILDDPNGKYCYDAVKVGVIDELFTELYGVE